MHQRQLLLQLGQTVAKAAYAPLHAHQRDGLGERVGERQEHERDLVVVSIERTASMFCDTFVRRLPWV